MAFRGMQALIDQLKETLISDKASLASEVLFQFQKCLKQLGNYITESQESWDVNPEDHLYHIGKESIRLGESL